MKSRSQSIVALVGLTLVVATLVVLSWPRKGHGERGVSKLVAIARVATEPPPVATDPSAPKLFQTPTLSKTQIAFAFAGEIWIVPREGGVARRLVTGQLRNSRPLFSPDGSLVTFTGTYDGNTDVYVVAAAGGEPRRLTSHPDVDVAVGWTPDGKSIVFLSTRKTERDLPRLFTVSLAGGLPEQLPLPSGTYASFSPDAKRLAYIPYQQWEPGWKKYRGGQTTPIWIADLADSHIVKVPRKDSNDRWPMWIGDTIYFVSDRNGPYTLFAYDQKAEPRELIHNPDGWDVRYASAGPDAIVYEQLGQIRLYDLAKGTASAVPITITADLPQVRPRFERVRPEQVLHATLSPTAKRVLVEARGEILSVPVEKGDVRNLTQMPGAADRDPAWSPDGKWIAWLSDRTGEYALYFVAPDGLGPLRKIDLGTPPSFFYAPHWSPDSKKIAITDKRMNLWLIDLGVDHPALVKIDSDRYDNPTSNLDPSWSGDSRWIAYVKQLPNHLHAVFAYSLDDKQAHQLTDGRSDATSPRFDRSGKYLWFTASTGVGLGAGWLDMSSMGRSVTASVYGIVLRKDLPSPMAPESDEEGEAGSGKPDASKAEGSGSAGDGKAEKPPAPVRIDFADIDQRVVALPIERANFIGLEAGAPGVLFLIIAPPGLADEDYSEFDDDHPLPIEVTRFDLKTRKVEKFLDRIDPPNAPYDGLVTFAISADATKVLYATARRWFVVGTDKAPKPDEGAIKMDRLEVWVDPRAEWRQMFHETWRIERDYLYDKNAHGLDLAAAEKLYAPFVDGIAGRGDLNVLFEDMLSNLVLGHVFVNGGALPHQDQIPGGLLGADYAIDHGRYKFARILHGENWNPRLAAPLTQPGVAVKEGEFLLAVNGRELRATDDVDELFRGTAGKQTVIEVGATAEDSHPRKVTVVPIPSEDGVRLRTWMDDNRKRVDAMSGGKIGYVYIPDTAGGGFTNFNRYYFSQIGKQGVVLDERFNHGGEIADYIVNLLQWKPTMGNASREGDDAVEPQQAIFGPKVMIANQMSGSGGDALPWLFKRAKIGPLVGVRTWGGLVGIGGYPSLIDGGSVTAPRWGLYGTHGEWEVENVGVAPDVEVEQDPALVRAGHDPQLEKATQLALDALAKDPPAKLVRPPYPNYGPRLPK